jgi:DNA polymerase (family 10)
LTLSGEGLSRGGEELPCSDESALYAALELPFIEPELREGRGEVEALGGEAPAAGPRSETPPFVAPRGPLLRLEDLRGTLHVHTTDSDGVHSLEEMAEAARALGLEYLGIADHSRSAAYAGGLSIGGLRAQGKTIDRLNARYAAAGEAFRVLKGVECDILRDGGLDYPDQVLAGLDFVVASVHSGFELEASKQTERLLRAIAHPATAVLGHPTGRLLLQRSGLTFDLPAILSACGARGVALELNAYPNRLDLDWRWHGAARAAGCRLAINPDAHTKDELAYVAYGVSIARKGGLTKADVLNAWPLDALRAHFAERRGTRTRLKGG